MLLSIRNILVRFTSWLLILACTYLTAASDDKLPSEHEGAVIAIGEYQLTRAEVLKILALLPPRQHTFFSKQPGWSQFADYIVRARLYRWEAERRGLNDRPDAQQAIQRFKDKLDKNQVQGLVIKDETDREQTLQIFKESLLARLVERELEKEIQVSSQEVAGYLQDHPSLFDMVRGRRIVIRSASSNHLYGDSRPADQILSDDEAKAKAEDLRREIQQGTDFEALAAKHSDDAMTSGVGGDIGVVRRGVPNKNLVTPPEIDLLFSMKVGQVSPVVGTPLGFTVLRLDEKRSLDLEEAKPEIEARVRNQKLEAWYQRMQLQHKVNIDRSFFATEDPTRAAAQP